MAKHIPKMPFTKKSSSTSSIGVRKKRKKEKEQPIVTSNCNDPVTAEDIQVTAAPAGLPLVSPLSSRKAKRKFSPAPTNTMADVNGLVEVFLQLEQLDDKLLCPLVVHWRKKLQTLLQTGTT